MINKIRDLMFRVKSVSIMEENGQVSEQVSGDYVVRTVIYKGELVLIVNGNVVFREKLRSCV